MFFICFFICILKQEAADLHFIRTPRSTVSVKNVLCHIWVNYPFKEHHFVFVSAQVVEGRGRTEGRSPECAVNTRCQNLCVRQVMRQEEQDGSIHGAPLCRSGNICENLYRGRVQLLLECRCRSRRNLCKSVARTALPRHSQPVPLGLSLHIKSLLL